MGASALESFANDFETSLSAAVTAADQKTITVANATGAPTSGNFRVRVNNEVMLVTAGHGTTTWTVARGQDNTSAAASHASGSLVTHVLTASGLVNSQLQSQEWTHGGTLHYTGASVTGSANTTAPSVYLATYGQSFAQQFTMTTGASVDRVILSVKAATANTSADVTVSIQTNGVSGPSGTLAGGSWAITLPGEFFTTTPRVVSVPIRASLSNGVTYWIVVSSQATDATNYLQLGYTATSSPSYYFSTNNGASWTPSSNRLYFDVFAGSTGLLVNATEDDALAPWNPTLTKGANWTELIYDASGSVTGLYEYLGSFRNVRTLSYDSSGVLVGVV